MRKLTVGFIALLFISLSACAWFEINHEASEAIAKISSRRIGAELQGRFPEIAKPVYNICQAAITDIEAKNTNSLIDYLAQLLSQEIEDSLLVADIIDLIELIQIKPDVDLTVEQINLVKIIAQKIMDGIELAGGNYGSPRIN